MILREVDIMCPPEYASKQEAKRFNMSCNCVVAHYIYYLKGVVTDGIWKVLIEVGGSKDSDIKSGPVLFITMPFDLHRYWTLDQKQKKKAVLECLHSGALTAAEFENWDKAPFKRAYKAVIEDDLTFNLWVGKWLKGPKGKKYAKLLCRFDPDSYQPVE